MHDITRRSLAAGLGLGALGVATSSFAQQRGGALELLNVSYDPTREYY